jgi:phasin family protein
MKQVGELAVNFTKRNIDTSFDFAENLVRAKDAQELMALHTDYVQSQIAALTDQAKELSKQAAKQSGRLALMAPPGLGIDLQFGAGTMIL